MTDPATQEPPSLDHPYYGVSFREAIKRGYRKWAVAEGRASAGEYWWFVLFVMVVTFALAGAGALLQQSSGDPGLLGYVAAVFYLANMIPLLTLGIRRLHDTGRSGWTYLITFVPCIGSFIVFVFLCGSTRRGAERFGPPYYDGSPAPATQPAALPTDEMTVAPVESPVVNVQASDSTIGAPAALDKEESIGGGDGVRRAFVSGHHRAGLFIIAIALVLIGAGLVLWPLLTKDRLASNEAGVASGVEQVDSSGRGAAAESDPVAPRPAEDPVSGGSEATTSATPVPEPTSRLDPPARPDEVGRTAGVWRSSGGKRCTTSTSKTTWGGYPAATCRFWQQTAGATTGGVINTGDRRIACQRDLGLENPVYAKNQTNTWWVWTKSTGGNWDWFPATAIAQGASDQAINGIAICQAVTGQTALDESSQPRPDSRTEPDGLTVGDVASFTHFAVEVKSVSEIEGQGARVRARVCVNALPDNPQGNRTRISWDPWRVSVDGHLYKPVRPKGHSSADVFPSEGVYRVGECATGWIPFSTLDSASDISDVHYKNGVGEVASWRVQ